MYCLKDNMITKDDTLLLKCMAIFMMIYHHFFAFPERIFDEQMYWNVIIGGHSVQQSIGLLCKICVSFFAFLSGYGLTKKYEKISFFEIIKKIVGIMMTYWIILIFIYVPLSFVNGICDVKEVLKNMFLIETSMIHPSWYVKFYVEVIIFWGIYSRVAKQIENVYFEVAAICFSLVLLNIYIKESIFLHYVPSFMWGYIIAKYSIYDRGKRKFPKMLYLINFILLTILGLLRIIFGDEIKGLSLTSFIVPILVYFLVNVFHYINERKLRKIKNTFLIVGRYSTYLWLLHAIFQLPNVSLLQRISYWPRLSILIVMWTIILLLPLSIVLDMIIKKINLRLFVK